VPVTLPAFSLPAAAPPVTSPLSLHDALPIFGHVASCSVYSARERCQCAGSSVALSHARSARRDRPVSPRCHSGVSRKARWKGMRSEEHTSELQSRENLVCRLLLEKKN